jgi:hypothetical protein
VKIRAAYLNAIGAKPRLLFPSHDVGADRARCAGRWRSPSQEVRQACVIPICR